MDVDPGRLEAFMGRMIGHMTGAALCYSVWLGDELGLVGKVLKAAAAAGRVVRARRLDARGSRLDDLERDRLRVVSLHLRHAGAHRVAREPAADEHDEPVQPRNAVAAVGERVDPELELLVFGNGRGHRSRR